VEAQAKDVDLSNAETKESYRKKTLDNQVQGLWFVVWGLVGV